VLVLFFIAKLLVAHRFGLQCGAQVQV